MALFGTVSSDIHFRNRIINGDMRIDQRNAGASLTPITGQYLLDRYAASLSQASKYSVQQNAGAVTPPTGFTDYLGVTSLSAYSILAGDFFSFVQRIEGLNVSDLAWGTANAQSVTVSFWVRSSLTGSFGAALQNSALDRSYPFAYTINAANTWEYKTVTVPGDTTGTWLTTNGNGIQLRFNLGTGSDRTGPAGAWAGANYNAPNSTVSVVGTNGATFYLTGVQLEAGSVATPFERRPFGTELALCQRYLPAYNRVGNDAFAPGQSFSSTTGGFFFVYPVTPRVNPTGIITSPVSGFYALVPNGTAARTVSSITFGVAGPVGASVSFSFADTGGSAGQANFVYSNTLGGQLLFTGCEL